MEIIVPKEYPLIMCELVFLCLLCFFSGILTPIRVKVFNEKFLSQFEEEHKKAFPGTKPDRMGLPDQGDGRYAAKLDYADWLTYNNAIRTHMN